jgi:hypothetical protein
MTDRVRDLLGTRAFLIGFNCGIACAILTIVVTIAVRGWIS